MALNDIIPLDALFEGNPDKGRKKKKIDREALSSALMRIPRMDVRVARDLIDIGIKESYELLALKDTQLINEDTFVASFASDGREKFGLELSMFLKSSCMSSCMHCTAYSVMQCKLVY